MLGASWKTGLIGVIAIAAGAMGMIADIVATQGMPKTIPEYFLFGGLVLGGIGHLLAKDATVTNAVNPGPASEVKS